MPYIASLEGLQALRAAVARRALARLRRLDPRRHGPAAGLAREAANRLARSGPAGARALLSPGILGSLHALEEASRLAALAERSSRAPAGTPAASRLTARLFDALVRTPHLERAAPRQVPDRGFHRRALALARAELAAAVARLAPALAAWVRDGLPGERHSLPVLADSDLATGPGEVALGGTAWLLRLGRGPAAFAAGANRLVVSRRGRTVLSVPLDALAPIRGVGAALVRRPSLPGAPAILIGRRLVSTRRSLRPAGWPGPPAVRRLAGAFSLLARVWPEASKEVADLTHLVVPLDEPGTVSYSLPARPGVSYINLAGKSLLALCDDLLHEAAHHKLHLVEELEPLVRDEGDPRWWSPWRRAWRPLRGIVHACYTFSHGALLFARLAAARDRELTPARRRFARLRLLEEDAMLAFSLADLARAARRGQLAPAGRELCAEMTGLHRDTVRPAAVMAGRAFARSGAPGRRALARIERLRASLEELRGRGPGETG